MTLEQQNDTGAAQDAGADNTPSPQGAEAPASQTVGAEKDGEVGTKSLDELFEEGYDKALEAALAKEQGKIREQVEAEKEVETKAKEEAEAKEAKKEEQEQTKAEDKPKKSLKPPASWNKEEIEGWDDIPEKHQEAIIRREKQQSRSATKLSEEAKGLREVAKKFEDIEQAASKFAEMSQLGTSDYLKSLVGADELARKDPLEYAKRFLSLHNIDLQALAEGSEEMAFDRRGWQESQRAAELEAENRRLQRSIQEQAAREQQKLQQKVASQKLETVSSYLQGKPEAHVRAVTPHMVELVPLIRQQYPAASDLEVIEAAWTEATKRISGAFFNGEPVNGTSQSSPSLESKKAAATMRSKAGNGSPPPRKFKDPVEGVAELFHLRGWA